MKILFIHKSYFPALREGGDTFILYNIATELARMGHDVTVYATNANADDNLPREYIGAKNIQGVNVYYFPRTNLRFLKKRYCAKNFINHLKNEIKDFDIVHIWSIYIYFSVWAGIISRRNQVPYVVSPQANFSPFVTKKNRILKYFYYKLIEKNCVLNSSGVQTNTAYDRKWAIDKGVPESLLLPVVTYGLNTSPSKTQVPVWKSSDPYFLFVGRIDRIKGLDFFLNAFSKFITENKTNVKLVIAGPYSGDYEVEFKQKILDLSLQDSVKFFGLVDDVVKQELLRGCISLVLPSYTESFGLVVLEAMAQSIPVLISDQCNVKDHVISAGCGFVLDHDEIKWAFALQNLYEEKSLCVSMGKKGLTYYLKNLTVRNCVEGLVRNYDSLLQNNANNS